MKHHERLLSYISNDRSLSEMSGWLSKKMSDPAEVEMHYGQLYNTTLGFVSLAVERHKEDYGLSSFSFGDIESVTEILLKRYADAAQAATNKLIREIKNEPKTDR